MSQPSLHSPAAPTLPRPTSYRTPTSMSSPARTIERLPLGTQAAGVDPGGDLVGVEAEEMAPLDVWDALLVDEAAHMTNVDAG